MFIGLATEHHDTYGVARKPLRSFLSKMHFEITKFDSAKKFWRKAAGGKNTFYFDFNKKNQIGRRRRSKQIRSCGKRLN